MQSSLAEQERIIGAGYADMLASMRQRASTLPAAAAGAEAVGTAAGEGLGFLPAPVGRPCMWRTHKCSAAHAACSRACNSRGSCACTASDQDGWAVGCWLGHQLVRLISKVSSCD